MLVRCKHESAEVIILPVLTGAFEGELFFFEKALFSEDGETGAPDDEEDVRGRSNDAHTYKYGCKTNPGRGAVQCEIVRKQGVKLAIFFLDV